MGRGQNPDRQIRPLLLLPNQIQKWVWGTKEGAMKLIHMLEDEEARSMWVWFFITQQLYLSIYLSVSDRN